MMQRWALYPCGALHNLIKDLHDSHIFVPGKETDLCLELCKFLLSHRMNLRFIYAVLNCHIGFENNMNIFNAVSGNIFF